MRRMTLQTVISLLFILAGFGAYADPGLTINQISDATPCAGDTITVSCTASQIMNANNIYTIEISDTINNFHIALPIGMLATDHDVVVITGVIPAGIQQDNRYLIRVVTSDPAEISNVESIFVEQDPTIMAGSTGPVNVGDSLVLSADSDSGSTYVWHHPNGIDTSPLQFTAFERAQATDAGDYTVVVTSPNGCKNSAIVTVEVRSYIITIPALPSSYCAATNASFAFNLSRDFDANNVFTAQLSDLTGSFENAVDIGELHSNTPGNMHVTFPQGVVGGTGYRIRIVSTEPATVSQLSTQFILRSAPVPALQTSRPLAFCQGETATITALGGVSYIWSNGSSEHSIVVGQTGNYAVTMTDQYGCVGSAMKSVVVYQPNNAYIINVGSTQICEGESVRLVAYDGASYNWSNGSHQQSITVDEAGVYNVTVTNSYGCSNVADTVEVTVIQRPEVTVSQTGTIDLCSGENITLTLTEGYENYYWSNGTSAAAITIDEAGDYSATVFDDAGCSVTTETVRVEMHDAPGTPEVTFDSYTGELFCTPGQFYQWYKDGVAIDGAIYHHLLVRNVNGLIEGTYTAEVSNVYGCSKMSSTYELFEVVSGITQKEKRILSLYPNPNNGIFELDIPKNAGMHIVVTNSIGRVVYDAQNNFERSQIDLTHLKTGVYFLKAYDETGVSSVMFLKN